MTTPIKASQWKPVIPGLWYFAGQAGTSYFQAAAPGQDALLIDPVQEITPGHLPGPADGLRVATTHLQREHVAGLANFSGTGVWIPAGDEYLCHGEAAYRQGLTLWQEPWEWETRGCFPGHMAGARNERPAREGTIVAGLLRPGQFWHGWEILPTPGHGKNAVALLRQFPCGPVAICGDLIYGQGQMWSWYDCEWDYGLQGGPHAVAASCRRLLQANPQWLLPAHGEPVTPATPALETLVTRLTPILEQGKAATSPFTPPLNFAEPPEEIVGWRRLSPHLFQWKTGNCALLVSDSGHGLLVDDGFCHWVPVPARRAHHAATLANIKVHLGLKSLEWVLVTHFHGDHTENIPALRAQEATQVATMACVSGPMEHPEQYNLAAALPWYDTENNAVAVDRILEQNEVLQWREYTIRAFHLGGQTYHHAGFETMVDGQRVCFVGDAIAGTSAACEPVLCYNDADPATRGWAYATNVLLTREADLLVCGHGAAIRQPQTLLQAKASAWTEMLDQYAALSPHAPLRAFFDPFSPAPGNF